MSILRFIIIFVTIFLIKVTADGNLTSKEFDCVIVPSNIANLGSNVRGVIKDIRFDKNDFVKIGQTVAVLDNNVEKAMVDLAKKRASINSEIALAKTSHELAKREQERVKKAYRRGVLTAHDIDVANTEVKLTKIRVLQAREKKSLAAKELVKAKAILAEHAINAPFAGIVMDKFKVEGEFIDSEPVLRLAQLDPLHVEIIVPVSQRDKIKKGMKARVCGITELGSDWVATVVKVDKVMDVASGTFGVRLLLPNKDYLIPAGLQCDLKFLN